MVTMVKSLKSKGVIFELFRSTSFNKVPLVADPHIELYELAPYVRLHSKYVPPADLVSLHKSARWFYYSSYRLKEGPPEYIQTKEDPETIVYQSTGKPVPSARTSNERLHELQDVSYYWEQFRGMHTRTPADDSFARRDKRHLKEPDEEDDAPKKVIVEDHQQQQPPPAAGAAPTHPSWKYEGFFR
eukprot:gnl/Hemi2/11760_TR4037_c0_g1_i2.p1 gnl/Hemi2/11760_TR4037_c0_g1~~gnl/Hemi2/11760_TR4037_c0_g1_i2.p1  ORF type:complete len:186 (+),score=39.48 gnl/Hemi2/11760_TR4037_c0_g1_i2:453-1010(+)